MICWLTVSARSSSRHLALVWPTGHDCGLTAEVLFRAADQRVAAQPAGTPAALKPSEGSHGLVAHKDVVTAILGASATLSGLVLVFFQLAVTAYQSRSAEVLRKMTVRIWSRRLALSTLASFIAGILCVGASTSWMLTAKNAFYSITVITFVIQLISLLFIAAILTWEASRMEVSSDEL